MIITQERAVEVIHKTNGKIFTAVFLKKDNTLREMNCRMGVSKYVTGVGLKFNPVLRGLLNVFDVQKHEYRFINLNTLVSIVVDKTRYAVENKEGFLYKTK